MCTKTDIGSLAAVEGTEGTNLVQGGDQTGDSSYVLEESRKWSNRQWGSESDDSSVVWAPSTLPTPVGSHISGLSTQPLGIRYLLKPSGFTCPSASGLHSTDIPGCPVPACILKWCLWKVVNCPIQVTEEANRFSTEWKVHLCKSLLLCLPKHPERHSTDSTKITLVQCLQS